MDNRNPKFSAPRKLKTYIVSVLRSKKISDATTRDRCGSTCAPIQTPTQTRTKWTRDLGFRAGGELRRGVNPLKDRLKLDNYVTRAMQDVMKPVRVASNLHLLNWEAPDAHVQEITPSGRVKRIVGKVAPWPHRRYG